jgi:hypothetical protein
MSRSITEVLVLSKVTVDATAGGKTLAELGLTLNSLTRSVSLQAVDGDIYVARGAATTDSFVLLNKGSVELKCLAITAKKLQFLSGGSVKMNVLELGE